MLKMLKTVKDDQDLGRVWKVGQGRGRQLKIVTACARCEKTSMLIGGHPNMVKTSECYKRLWQIVKYSRRC